MKRLLLAAALALILLPATPAQAQATMTAEEQTELEAQRPFGAAGLKALGVGIGLGLIIMGASKGIGAIGSHAVDAIARQPEAGDRIFTSMIISAALIEGATLFAIVVTIII